MSGEAGEPHADAHSWLRTSVPRQRRRFAAEHAFGQVDQEDLLFAEDLRKLEPGFDSS